MNICVLMVFFTVWVFFDCVQSSPASPWAWTPRPDSVPPSPTSSREPSPESPSPHPSTPRTADPGPSSSSRLPSMADSGPSSSSRLPSMAGYGPSSFHGTPKIAGYEFDSRGILMVSEERKREAFLTLFAFAQNPPHKQEPGNLKPAIHKAQILVPIASDIYYRDEDFAGVFVTPNLIHRINFATLEPVMHNGQPVIIHPEELRAFDDLIRDKHLYGRYDGREFRKLAKHLRKQMIP